MSAELKACPFCGNRDLDVGQWIECNSCGAFGPTPKNCGELSNWNDRPDDALRDALQQRLVAAGQSVDQLRAFANDMINASFEGGSFECGDIQDIAVKHGLLHIEPRDEECGEVCACSEYGFPAKCYRKTPLLNADPATP